MTTRFTHGSANLPVALCLTATMLTHTPGRLKIYDPALLLCLWTMESNQNVPDSYCRGRGRSSVGVKWTKQSQQGDARLLSAVGRNVTLLLGWLWQEPLTSVDNAKAFVCVSSPQAVDVSLSVFVTHWTWGGMGVQLHKNSKLYFISILSDTDKPKY